MIRIKGLSISLGMFELRDIDLNVDEGEYVVVMGPTGSGKTVLLECLVGLYSPSSGEIRIDGRRVEQEPPERRGLAYVPQDYCLFPHMRLRDNITYGMRLRRQPPEVQERKTRMLSELLGISHILDRRPLHLSGGERQRGALARALAIDPAVLLLDEPLSAVDEATRDDLCEMLKNLQTELGLTILHVSHSIDEALSVADRIAVFGQGTILQEATPAEVMCRPASSLVARCVGGANILHGVGVTDAQGTRYDCGGLRLRLDGAPQGPGVLILRPEHLRIPSLGPCQDAVTIQATIRRRQNRGALVWFSLDACGVPLLACVASSAPAASSDELTVNAPVAVDIPYSALHFAPT